VSESADVTPSIYPPRDLAEAQERLKWYITTKDAESIVIRGAILIEGALEDRLRTALHNADKLLQIKRMSFARKTSLAAAIGLINDEMMHLIDEYRVFRNEAAHRVGFEVRRADEEALLRRFEAHGYFHLDRHYDAIAFPRTLMMLGVFLYSHLILSGGQKLGPVAPRTPQEEKWRDHIFPTYFVFQALYPESDAWERAKAHLNARGIFWTKVDVFEQE
jgi:hypothetical protein